MEYLKIKYLKIMVLILILLPAIPIWNPVVVTNTYASGGGSVNVNLPIDEIRSLINQLEEAAADITGQAGIEIRASIGLLSSELKARLDQIGKMANELWGTVITDLDRELRLILSSIETYLNQVNQMAADRITQLSQELAQRIDQISDRIEDRLNQVDTIVQNAIKSARDGAIDVVDRGRTSVLIVIDSFTKKIVKAAIILLDIILLLLIGISAWKNKIPTKVAQKIIVTVVFVIFFGVSSLFVFSNKVLASVLGKQVELTNPSVAATEANNSYSGFTNTVRGGANIRVARELGLAAIAKLRVYQYVAKDPAESKQIEEKINKIQAVLYPPPKPETLASPHVVLLGKYSKYYNVRVESLQKVASELHINSRVLYRPLRPLRLDQPIVAPRTIHPR